MNRVKMILCVPFLLGSFTIAAQDGFLSYPRKMAVGLDVNILTGVGFEVSTPIGSHFAVRAGFTTLPLKYKTTVDFRLADAMEDDLVTAMSLPQVQSELAKNKLPTKASDVVTEMDLTARLGMTNGKLLVDVYPFKRIGIHVTGGLFFGKEKLVSVEGKMPETMKLLETIGKAAPQYNLIDKPFIEGYNITAKDLMNIDAAISIKKVKPYLGLGFGRAVPKRRVSFVSEFGFIFQGSPTFTSSKKPVSDFIDDNLSGLGDVLKGFKAMPVMSFRLNVALF